MSTPAEQLQALLEALVTLLLDAAQTTRFYAYERYLGDASAVEAALGVADAAFSKGWAVRYWTIDRSASSESAGSNDENVQVHTLRLRGYWEVNDAGQSRATFRASIEAMCAVLRALPELAPDLALSGVPQEVQDNLPVVELCGPPQVSKDAEVIMLGETYLCHQAELSMQAQVRLRRQTL
jgi:hypothetical protein